MGTYWKGSAVKGRKLRENMTDAERKLWARLRNRQLLDQKFVRQLPVGRYVADFACRDRDLIIEVDGGQHADSAKDQHRTEALAAFGYRVLRFWNNDVLNNMDGVLQVIADTLAATPSSGLRFVALEPVAKGPLTRSFGPTSPPEGEVTEGTAEFPSSPHPLVVRVRPAVDDEEPAMGHAP